MAEVFVSARTGAQVVVFSHDHCPPHVSALKRREAWLARVGFSFVTDAVALWDIEPLRNAPRRREIGLLLDEIQDDLAACRRVWWSVQGTTCLEGRLAKAQEFGQPGSLTFLARRRGSVRQVRTAVYDSIGEDLTLDFNDGSRATIKAGTGDEA
ncbi:hypothetical protein MKL09_04725 [Methylobacterium sp. J-048]|uniref:hypothetical protein n=1 Tax=Methylobacterium sp. J-048 TaxID=2836635 RepID=UPI001FB98B6E|nr:hypothetical protein [Methylobacterium sp. J-048]MCJ2055852.1 hypothetical protein [Methylobacterium sp. J-048]